MLRRAQYCYGKSSVCPSVRDVEVRWFLTSHIGWKLFENNFTFSYLGVFTVRRPQHHGSTPMETPPNFGRNRGGVSKKLLAYKISLKRGMIGPRLLLTWGPIGSHITRFRLVPKSTTLDDQLKGYYAPCFKAGAPWCCYLFIFSFTFSLRLVDKWMPVL